MIQFILVFVFALSHGFLLQTNSPLNSGTVGNQQYITKLELYDTKNQLQNELNYVRNDMNTKLDVLTSQLQQMLASFQQQIAGQGSHNDSKAIENVELKYNEVLRNYTYLQKEFNSLQKNYFKQEIELQSVKNKTKEHENEFVNLNILKNKEEVDLQSVRNKTKELEDEIVNLNSLKNINHLIDFRSLQQEVQSISAQTHSLAVNEQARIQDFQALYNGLKEHEINEGRIIQSLNSTLYQKFQSSEISTNASLSNVMTRISESENHQNNNIEKLEKSFNVSFWGISQKIAKNSEKVALTACAEYSEHSSSPHLGGYIIKYSDIRTQVNVNNLSSFRSSGKFTCEKEGLYLVSAWDKSNIGGSECSIYKNGNMIANAYIAGSHGYYDTATAVVAVELIPNDTVWVQVVRQMDVFDGQTSCLTLVKVQ